MLSNYTVMKFEINIQEKFEKLINMWKLDNCSNHAVGPWSNIKQSQKIIQDEWK